MDELDDGTKITKLVKVREQPSYEVVVDEAESENEDGDDVALYAKELPS